MIENCKCVYCSSDKLERLPSPRIQRYSTGDRREYEVTGDIFRVICNDCGGISFAQNIDYINAIDWVFDSYSSLIEKTEDASESRLTDAIKRISDKSFLSKEGIVLDIGCGSGEFLESFKVKYSDWITYGLDIGKQFKESVERKGIVFFEKYSDITDKYDFISLNSVLYGVENPIKVLKEAVGFLKEDGYIYIYETNIEVNPYTIYAIDTRNCLYFDFMRTIIKSVDLEFVTNIYEDNSKEYGIIAKKKKSSEDKDIRSGGSKSYQYNKKTYLNNVCYIDKVIDKIEYHIKQQDRVGVFGTSIAGIWVKEIIDSFGLNKEVFYIDEDIDVNNQICDTAVFQPKDIDGACVVFLPFPRYISEKIKEKMSKNNLLSQCDMVIL